MTKLNKILIALAFIAVFMPDIAEAVQRSQPLPSDRRIRTYIYRPDTVYAYTGHYGYQSRIDLDPAEKVLSMSLGDPTRWLMQTVGHRLFLKPIEFDATTNMTIITSKRIYYFELYAEEADGIDDESLVFAAKFIYGDDGAGVGGESFQEFSYPERQVPDPMKEGDKLNYNYTITGSRYISPLEIFDDGEFTYMKFKDINADLPAVFQVLPGGDEALINFRMRDGYMVIEMVTSQFTLRYGDRVACVYNETMPLDDPYSQNGSDDPNVRRKSMGIY